MRIFAIGLLAVGLGACASPDHTVAEARDVLTIPPAGAQTPGEALAECAAESDRDGCRVARRGLDGIEGLAERDNAYTRPVPVPPPPALPSRSGGDD